MNRSHLIFASLVLPGVLFLATSCSAGAGVDIDDVIEEQKMRGNCPEYCTCLRQIGDGAVAHCSRITATQRFNNLITSFYMYQDKLRPSFNQNLELGEKFFRNMEMKSVDSIEIVDIQIVSIDVNAFQGLHGLSQVNLTNNNLQVLHPDTFANNENLQRLCINNNPLTFTQKSRTPYVLNIPDLMELDLSACQLYNVLPTTLSTLHGLSYLNLASNYISNLDPRTFSNNTALEEINLSNNKIESLHPDLFKFNEDLSTLVLNNNPLTSVENMKLFELSVLDLSYCRITKLTSESLAGFMGVSNLNLSSNAITDLSANTFSKMSRLYYLDLSNNNFIGQLDENLFLNNKEIATITLKDNPNMGKLPDDGFKGQFGDLYKLDVSNCGLETLASTTFLNMPNLSHLDISRNTIKTLALGVLPRKIKHLSLAYNKITSLGHLQFPKEFQLRQLYLQGNQIKQLNPNHLTNLPYLTKLDLSSCGMVQLWLKVDDNTPYLKTVRKLNLSKNNLLQITPRDLMIFSELTSLDITSNPLSCNSDDLHSLITYLNKAHVDPYDMGGVEEKYERFEWEDIWLVNCNRNKNDKIRVEENTPDEEEKDKYEYEEGSSDDSFEGNDDENSNEMETDRDRDEPTKLHISTSSYQLIVMILAASATFVSILLLVLIFKLCKHQLTQQRNNTRQRRGGNGAMSYKPLHDNEYVNSPTTPIMKTKLTPIVINSEANNNASNEEMGPVPYSQTIGKVTYLSSSFHNSNIVPDAERV